ncbi:MAG: DEAD/DEAH box helicase [Bacilli bacterium]
MKFSELGINEQLVRAAETLKFEAPTKIQEEVIPQAVAGLDVIGQAKTGTGKTGAYGFAILNNIDLNNEGIQTLIMSPTRELALQITGDLGKYGMYMKGVKVATLYGGEDIMRQIRSLKRNPQIIVATPGRLMDHMRRKTINLEGLRTLILDEADEMLDMGFREDIDCILESVSNEHQTMLFSATFPSTIVKICNKYLHNPVRIKLETSSLTVESVQQYHILVRQGDKVEAISRLIDFNEYKMVMIFCNTKREVDEVSAGLLQKGYIAEGLHGDMRQMQRDRVMNRFRDGLINILVASDVAARGLDVNDIDVVINYDLPDDEEYYIHRIGRTGRASKKGVSISLVNPKEKYRLRSIVSYTKADIQPMEIPAIDAVLTSRVNKIVDKALETKSDNKKIINDAIYKKIKMEGLVPEEILVGMITGIIDKVEAIQSVNETRSRKSSAHTSGLSRCFMNVGKFLDYSSEKIKTVIAANSKVEEGDVQNIEVHDDFSFFEVKPDLLPGLLDAFSSLRIEDKRVIIEEAQSKKSGGRSGGNKRRGSGRSSGGRSSSRGSYGRRSSDSRSSSSSSSEKRNYRSKSTKRDNKGNHRD